LVLVAFGGEANCHPADKGHVVWAEAALTRIQESLKGE